MQCLTFYFSGMNKIVFAFTMKLITLQNNISIILNTNTLYHCTIVPPCTNVPYGITEQLVFIFHFLTYFSFLLCYLKEEERFNFPFFLCRFPSQTQNNVWILFVCNKKKYILEINAKFKPNFKNVAATLFDKNHILTIPLDQINRGSRNPPNPTLTWAYILP